MPSQNDKSFVLFTQKEVDKIKEGLPYSEMITGERNAQ